MLIAEKCANRSSPPPSGVMKPKPFASLNHLTVPVAIVLLPYRVNGMWVLFGQQGPPAAREHKKAPSYQYRQSLEAKHRFFTRFRQPASSRKSPFSLPLE